MTRSVQRPQAKLLAARAIHEDAPALVKPCVWLDAQRQWIDLVNETSCLTSSWNCDDGSGTTLTDAKGANNGTLATASWATDGGVTAASGDHAQDHTTDGYYTTVTHDAGLNTAIGAVSIWAKASTTPAQYDSIWMKSTSGSWNDGGGIYCNSSSEVRAFVGAYGTYAAATGLTLTDWHHYVVTWDSVVTKLYVDGAFVSGVAQTPGMAQAGNLLIGAGVGSNGYTWPGYTDRMGWYSQCLTPEEVSALYAAGSPATNALDFPVGGVDAWRDRSVYGNDGADDGTSYGRITAGNASGRPIRFDLQQGPGSAGQYVQCATSELTSVAGWTIFCAMHTITLPGTFRYLVSSDDVYFSVNLWQDSANKFGFGCDGTVGTAYRSGSTTVAINTDYLVTARYDGSQGTAADRLAQLRVNRVDETLGAVTGTPAATTATVANLKIPHHRTAANTSINALLYEMIIVPRSCSASEIAMVEDYLSTKWGI